MKCLNLYSIILLFLTFIIGCNPPNEEMEILNQIFPELTIAMNVSVVKPIAYPPPLPKTIFPSFFQNELSDTCINRHDLAEYRSSLEAYNKYLQNYYFDNYAFRQDSINTVIGIVDSLGYCIDCGVEDEFPVEYSGVIQSFNEYSDLPNNIDLDQIRNTGVFQLKFTSEIGWYPKINLKEFRSIKRDYYLSCVLSISKIYLDKSKTHGLFSCIKVVDHIEPFPLIIGIKKKENKWYIDRTFYVE